MDRALPWPHTLQPGPPIALPWPYQAPRPAHLAPRTPRRARRRTRKRLAMAPRQVVTGMLAALLAASGGSLVATGLASAPVRPPMPPLSVIARLAAPPPAERPAPQPPADNQVALGRSTPVELDIPAIGVHSGLTSLGLNPDGTVALPPLTGAAPAGWYRNLAAPGEVGPAVILGHVDSAAEGPAVFFRLGALRPGDTLSVRRADGVTATFTVDTVARFPKSRFPTADVYGPATYPKLTLVTCGGTFDRTLGSYSDNVVVYARLTAP